MNEKKEILQIRIDSKDFETRYYKTYKLKELSDFVNECESKGATDISFYARGDSDGDVEEVELAAFYEQEESDEAFTQRMKAKAEKQKAEQQSRIERERNLYEELKKKFETTH